MKIAIGTNYTTNAHAEPEVTGFDIYWSDKDGRQCGVTMELFRELISVARAHGLLDDGDAQKHAENWKAKFIDEQEKRFTAEKSNSKYVNEIAILNDRLFAKSKEVEELRRFVPEIESHKAKLQADIDRLLVANGKLEQQLKETHGIMRATDARLEVQLKRNQQLSDENAKLKRAMFGALIQEFLPGQFRVLALPGIQHIHACDRASAEAAILRAIGINQ